jgi:hypothetical protein
VLRGVTGKDIGFVAYADPEVRAGAAAEWRRWIGQHGRATRLTLPAPADSRLGKVLLCSFHRGRVVELDECGRKVWETHCSDPDCCEGLPDGHRLVGTFNGKVREYDAAGKLVWGLEGPAGEPIWAVRRLPSGNTLVVRGVHGSRLQEFRPDRSVSREKALLLYPGRAIDVQQLDNGNRLEAYRIGRVVERDRQGEVVWELRGLAILSSVQRLNSGNTLVSQQDMPSVVDGHRRSKVLELGPDGKVVWSHDIEQPGHAQRLANGHTLISSNLEKVVEIDAAGRVVWEYAEKGVTHFFAY